MFGPALSEPLSTFVSFILSGAIGSDVASSQVSTPAIAPVSASAPWLGFASALAWPIAAVAIALAFREPLSQFLSGLSGRVTKLSAFKVELELATAPAAGSGPLLDDIRSATTLAPIADSTRMMLEQAQSTVPADFAVIDLGTGEEWLTSRLFIAAVMLERMRAAKVMVFLETTPTTTRRFVAIGSLAEVRWSLARQFPWLEASWARAYMDVFPAYPPAGVVVPNGALWLPDPLTIPSEPSPIQSSSGAIEPWTARNLVASFIKSLQMAAPGILPSAPPASVTSPIVPVQSGSSADSWVLFASGTQERARWVTRTMLETMLPPMGFELWMDENRDASRAKRTRSLLRRPGPFVALVRGDREYVRLVKRSVLLEELAAWSGEEPQ